ncbi:LuxR C-terminal-related transcriptional regulator [Chryseobacterium lactis]|uniref:LuxR C-terminal-related transcriptional regulator n=1 Tax=Chryseobacterium lactis TaxID=1241981 RepID=UPI00162497B5|nr:LuxR C-terminal-related transcriptional regulator [Chryseobacterium lactis]
MKNTINPIDRDQFFNYFFIGNHKEANDYNIFYAETIEGFKKFAISPYFWFITNNMEMRTKVLSDNIEHFTPFTKEEWLDSDTDFFINLFHPDDRFYLMGAFEFSAKMIYMMEEDQKKNIRFNFYGRMIDRNNNYRWILLQSPLQYRNENKEIESSLVVIYDLAHFHIINKPLLSIMDFNNHEIQYFKHIEQNIQRIEIEKPAITKREKEILKLMAMGLNTPEIASSLFISYHTVENHKRNLRQKTHTKTSSELIAFTMTHSLLLL